MHNAQPFIPPHPSAAVDLILDQPIPALLRPGRVVVYRF